MTRIILDVSSVARWRGPAVGILRVEQALARHALAQRPDIVLSFYEAQSASFYALNPRWAAHVVGWHGAVGRRRGALASLLPSPYWIVGALDRCRPASGEGTIARGIARLQQLVLLVRRRRRRGVVPFTLAIGRRLVPGSRDIVLSTGSDWIQKDAASIAALKNRFGFCYVVMCHDIIPLLLPQYFSADDAAAFRRYWTTTFSVADQILVNSRRVADDIAGYCKDNDISFAPLRRVRLGYEKTSAPAAAALPDGLEKNRFILFVSTIEPRKGHSLLIRVWQRLLAAKLPQQQHFKLVFVGRRGWQVDAVLDQIDNSALFDRTLRHLVAVGDDELDSLYRAAAFCVYPSRYEGFGLPIVEAFSHGKAVIASTGGALPELVGDLSPCLDPDDEDAWFDTMRTWIEQPDSRRPYEAKIRANFSWPDWDEAAAQIFAAVHEAADESTNQRSRMGQSQ